MGFTKIAEDIEWSGGECDSALRAESHSSAPQSLTNAHFPQCVSANYHPYSTSGGLVVLYIHSALAIMEISFLCTYTRCFMFSKPCTQNRKCNVCYINETKTRTNLLHFPLPFHYRISNYRPASHRASIQSLLQSHCQSQRFPAQEIKTAFRTCGQQRNLRVLYILYVTGKKKLLCNLFRRTTQRQQVQGQLLLNHIYKSIVANLSFSIPQKQHTKQIPFP